MNKLDSLLKVLQLDNNYLLDHLSLEKVYVTAHNTFYFYFHSEDILPYKEFKELYEELDNFLYENVPVFQYDAIENEDYLFDYVNEVYTELLDISYDSSFQREDFSYSQGLATIKVDTPLKMSVFEEYKSELLKYLDKYGIRIHIAFDLIEDENKEEEIESKVKEYVIDPDLLKKKKKTRVSYKKEYDTVKIADIDNTIRDVAITGYCFKTELVTTKSGKHIQTLYVTDYTDSILVKRFENKLHNTLEAMNEIGKGKVWIRVKGRLEFDKYADEEIIITNNVEIIPAPLSREDKAQEKRVELHSYTNMSSLDGIPSVDQYVSKVASWGHKAFAITDRGNVQSFPDAQFAAKKNNIKMIYGVEFNMIDNDFTCGYNLKDLSLKDLTYVSFDLETTGLSQIDDYITEIGCVKVKNGMEIDRFQTFVKSPKPISASITNLTSITNRMIENAPTFEEVWPKLKEFFKDYLLVAHNGVFDIGMLNKSLKELGKEEIQNPWIDSLPLSRHLIPLMRSYRLGAVCHYYKISYDGESAHRADYDAEVLSYAFNRMLQELMSKGIYNFLNINDLELEDAYKHAFGYHMVALAKNKTGLKNMFKLVSIANTEYFYQSDRIPRDILIQYREGLLFGSGGLDSKMFDIAATRSEEELRTEIKFYDYIEIQPLGNANYLVDRGRYESIKDIENIYKRIVKIAKEENKIIVATGDVHYIEPHDKIFRDVFITNEKLTIGGRPHPLLVRNNPRASTPDVYLRTTDEMLDEFPYLSYDETYEYVVTNTNKIADMIDDITVVKSKLYTPNIEHVGEKLTELCYKNAHKMYGDPLPELVEKRLERELGSIIKHGFAVIYYIASELVRVSNEAGYLVGSRGSVGSSFVATASGISEVNPLPPHYYCPHCAHNEFIEDGSIQNGYDLPDKYCPVCGSKLKGDGHNIPFETFLGFNADKVPDIDLNFSGEYQPEAHNYTKKIFGEDHVFRAGTISTVAEKTAYGYAKAYAERLGIDSTIRSAQLQHIADGCTGVKRTTGQHPGGIIVIPENMDVFDFTPYQYPADDINASWKTTHFDFHKIHDNVLKFDILGHVDPTVIRMLQDLTGVDPKTIPTNDEQVMSLFSSTKALNIDLSYLNCRTGALGLPEFGTRFVRGMLEQTNPKTFSDLVIISGLSHGTDVYLGNAETLIKTGTCTLSDVIGCRDDIMVYLIDKGLPNKDAFDIMECVRKGRSPQVFPEKKYEELMRQHNVPQWYIDSCKKIKYMFPKAHAAAYVLSAIRVAWWKLYYPREYYAVYFTTRCDAYDIETLIKGKESVLNKYRALQNSRTQASLSNKDEALLAVFEIALEMFDRGYHFNNINMEKSDSTSFVLDKDDPLGIIPPFSSIDGLGDSVGDSVVQARNEHSFTSVEDIRKRTRLSNTHLEQLELLGVFEGLSLSNQLSIFDLF